MIGGEARIAQCTRGAAATRRRILRGGPSPNHSPAAADCAEIHPPEQAVLTVADSGGAGSAPVQGRRDPELSRRRRLNTHFPKRRVTENNQHHPKRLPAAPTSTARREAEYGPGLPPSGIRLRLSDGPDRRR